MACDIPALEAKLAEIDQQLCDLRNELVSQALGTTTSQGGRKFIMEGPKGGKIEFQEGGSGSGSSASSLRSTMDTLTKERIRLQRQLNRCKRNGRSISPQLNGVDVSRKTGTGCDGC